MIRECGIEIERKGEGVEGIQGSVAEKIAEESGEEQGEKELFMGDERCVYYAVVQDLRRLTSTLPADSINQLKMPTPSPTAHFSMSS